MNAHGIAGGRFFTAILGWLTAFLTAWLATRLVPRPQRRHDLRRRHGGRQWRRPSCQLRGGDGHRRSALFRGDDLRLKQILSNLVSNAIKFTDEGEVSVTVKGIEKSGRTQLLFEVTDTGIGISPEAGKTLF